MKRGLRSTSGVPSAHRRLLGDFDEDPLSGMANLFDMAMMFAASLLLVLVTQSSLPELRSQQDETTVLKNPGKPNMEIIRRKGRKLEHYRMSQQALDGEGERLGVAYRLKTGELVYVPGK